MGQKICLIIFLLFCLNVPLLQCDPRPRVWLLHVLQSTDIVTSDYLLAIHFCQTARNVCLIQNLKRFTEICVNFLHLSFH